MIEVKEIKMRPGIDDNDYNIKMRKVREFLDEGDKVKVTMRFQGREMAHQHLAMDILEKVKTEIGDIAKVEQMPKLEGRQMIMVMAPLKNPVPQLHACRRDPHPGQWRRSRGRRRPAGAAVSPAPA